MNKLLVAALCGIAMTCSPAHAYAEKLFIVNPASNTGNTFKMSNAFKKDFEAAGYDVELISPGDKCKAYLMLQKVKKIAPTFYVVSPWEQAKAKAGLLGKNCGPVEPDEDKLIMAYLDHSHICTFKHKDNPLKILKTMANYTIGTVYPSKFWQGVVDKLNIITLSKNKRIEYSGSGKARAALLAGEIDFAFLSTGNTMKVESNGGVCTAEITKHKPIKYGLTINDVIISINPFDSSIASGWHLFGATEQQVKTIRTLVKDWYHSTDSAIIKYFGGKHPVNNYAWEVSNSKKVKWIKDAIQTWANAVRK